MVRQLRWLAAPLALVSLLAACGSDDDASSVSAPSADATSNISAGAEPETVTDSSESTDVAESPDAAFPVTVETAFGDVTIDEQPERVVALGWSDAETALALGVQPVGATDWLGFGGPGVGAWAEGLYDEAPMILERPFNFEAIAALEPDLILNTVSDGDGATHETLSEIAPTVSMPEGAEAWGTTWQQQLEIVSQALGEEELGQQLAEETQAAFDAAAAEHPEFEGQTIAVAARFGDQYGAYVRPDTRVAFVEALGFTNKPELEAMSTGSFYVMIALEEADQLDADLTVLFPIGEDAIEPLNNDPLLQQVPSAMDGRLIVLEDLILVRAFSANSVLSINYALEHAPDVFAAALA